MTPLDRALATVARAPRYAVDLAIGAAPLVVGAASGALTAPAIRSWYRRLERPSWNPPDGVFGPVWTALYATMGVALVRVVRSDRPADDRRLAVGLFGLQLALNFGWSWIFFVEHEIGLAVAEILVAVGRDRRDGCRLRPAGSVGRVAPRSVPRLGDVRRCAEHRGLAAESLRPAERNRTLRPDRPSASYTPRVSAVSSSDLAAAADHLTPVLGRYFERSWSHGEGHRLYDTSGKAYLDFANGIAVTALGHRHPRVTAAIHAQVDQLIGPTGAIGYAEPVVRLATMLAGTLPEGLDSVMFLNSGSEAIDAALKLARRVTGRPGMIAFRGGFHGRTFGAMSITTSNLNYRTGYEPLVPGVYLAPYPAAYPEFEGDADRAAAAALAALRTVLETEIAPAKVASIVIEPVLGEGGYQPAAPSFLVALREICDEHGILLIADEVQTGYARTGRMWGFETAGIIPDVVVVAKAIANGLPLSAIVTTRTRMEQWGRSAHGSTYGGNPVACAAGIAVLETIADERLIENATARGDELRAGLDRVAVEDPRIGNVRGRGLMLGVEFIHDETGQPDGALAKAVIARAADLGLLVLTCGMSGQVVRWIPPINATSAEVSEAVEIFAEAVRTV